MRILLFDDSIPIQKAIRLGLRNRPRTELRVTETLEQAQATAATFRPELIIASETVGGQRQAALHKLLRFDRKQMIILAHDDIGKTRAAEEGYTFVLNTPFQLAELRSLLDQFTPSSPEDEAGPVHAQKAAPSPPQVPQQEESAISTDFSEGLGQEDTALLRIDFKNQTTDMETGFRDTLKLNTANGIAAPAGERDNSTWVAQGTAQTLALPEITMDIARIEQDIQGRSVDPIASKSKEQKPTPAAHQPIPAQERAIGQTPAHHQGHGTKAKVQPEGVEERLLTRADPDFINQLEDVVEHQSIALTQTDGERQSRQTLGSIEPEGRAKTAPIETYPTLTPSQRLALDESIHQILDNRLVHEFRQFEMRAKARFMSELEVRLFAEIEDRVNPAIEKYLNTHWQALVRSVTSQARKSIDADTTQKIDSQVLGLKKKMAHELRAELRVDIKDALQNWMGSYSRDILKEVAREELQKLMESV